MNWRDENWRDGDRGRYDDEREARRSTWSGERWRGAQDEGDRSWRRDFDHRDRDEGVRGSYGEWGARYGSRDEERRGFDDSRYRESRWSESRPRDDRFGEPRRGEYGRYESSDPRNYDRWHRDEPGRDRFEGRSIAHEREHWPYTNRPRHDEHSGSGPYEHRDHERERRYADEDRSSWYGGRSSPRDAWRDDDDRRRYAPPAHWYGPPRPRPEPEGNDEDETDHRGAALRRMRRDYERGRPDIGSMGIRIDTRGR